jgi:hypothetical protein
MSFPPFSPVFLPKLALKWPVLAVSAEISRLKAVKASVLVCIAPAFFKYAEYFAKISIVIVAQAAHKEKHIF